MARAKQKAKTEGETKEEMAEQEQLPDYLACLTNEQRNAVTQRPEQSLQILAGPGSGKTRVLTSRAAWMILEGYVQPDRLVLVTFTNKAAREMINRLNVLIGPARTDQLIIGTFHATCCRFLRRHGQKIGLPNSFTIADIDDVKKLLKRIITENATHLKSGNSSFPEDVVKPDSALNEISKAKSKNLTAAEYRKSLPPKASTYKLKMAFVYEKYEEAMQKNSALDFDDLLLYGVRLLKQHPSVVDDIEHVLVDEFQDTNTAQFQLMELLAQKCRAVTTVGDPDQSIYGWRSAEVANLQKMVNKFSGTQRVYLEENFRSTGNIVETALKVVQQDSDRVQKKLYTSHPGGPPVVLKACRAPDAEAAFIVSEIKRVIAHSGEMLTYDDFVILLRYNALSRVLEAELQKEGVPHRLMGGVKFFDRVEVKDILAYLCLVDNPDYAPAFDRIVNVPKRAIGDKTLKDIAAAADEANMGPMALGIALNARGSKVPKTSLSGKALNSLKELGGIIIQLQDAAKRGCRVSVLIEKLMDLVGYRQHLEKQTDGATRMENVKELINFAVGIEKQAQTRSDALAMDDDDAGSSSSPSKSPSKLYIPQIKFDPEEEYDKDHKDSTAPGPQPKKEADQSHAAGDDDDEAMGEVQPVAPAAASSSSRGRKRKSTSSTASKDRSDAEDNGKGKAATTSKAKGKAAKGKAAEDPIVIDSESEYADEGALGDDDDDIIPIDASPSKRSKIKHEAATAAVEMAAGVGEDGSVPGTGGKSLLRVFLEASTMSTDMEVQEEGKPLPRVTISTCHAAKGLEWPVVFIAGVEDGILPFFRCKEPDEIKEERRLLYVAITRAETLLYMSWCCQRPIAGQGTKDATLSQFLATGTPKGEGGSLDGNTASKEEKAKQINCVSKRPPIGPKEREVWAQMLGRPTAPAAAVKKLMAEFDATITGAKILDGEMDKCVVPDRELASRSFGTSSSFNKRFSSGSYSTGKFNSGSYNRYGSGSSSSSWGNRGGGGYKKGWYGSYPGAPSDPSPSEPPPFPSTASSFSLLDDVEEGAVASMKMESSPTGLGEEAGPSRQPAQPPSGPAGGFQTARAAFGGSVAAVAAAAAAAAAASRSQARRGPAPGRATSSSSSSLSSFNSAPFPSSSSSSCASASASARVKPAPRFTDEVRLQAGARDIRSFLLPNGTAPRPAADLASFQSANREASSLAALKSLLPEDDDYDDPGGATGTDGGGRAAVSSSSAGGSSSSFSSATSRRGKTLGTLGAQRRRPPPKPP
ncbi:ATP-dependent DNA helicase srs2 [Tilletia horrida]|nr:ATP-dependent DNA helicase srs2 [Tilletia horrida]